MKKAKVILTAITVFAVVGGALAFKAKNFGSDIFCTNSSTASCNVKKANFTITTTNSGTTSYCSVSSTTGTCPLVSILSEQ